MYYQVSTSVTDYYIDARDRAYPQVEATASHHGLTTVVPSVHEGEPIRVIHKAEDGTILQEYRLHLTSDAEKLKQAAPVAVEAGRRFSESQSRSSSTIYRRRLLQGIQAMNARDLRGLAGCTS